MESDAPEEQVWRQIGLENKIIDKAEASEIAVMYSTRDAQQNVRWGAGDLECVDRQLCAQPQFSRSG